MSENAGFRKEETVGTGSPTVAVPPSCRKKKADMNEGFVKDLVSHIDEFVNASYDEHKTCLQKTVRKVMSCVSAVGSAFHLISANQRMFWGFEGIKVLAPSRGVV